jgi:hypothetical protein
LPKFVKVTTKKANIKSKSSKASPPSRRRSLLDSKGASRVRRKLLVSKDAIFYVLPLGNGWVIKSNLASRFTAITDSKRDAISIARNIAKTKKSELIVHGKSGKIETRESYVL